MSKKTFNLWDVLLVNKPTKPNDLGFEDIIMSLHANMEHYGIPLDPSKALSFFSKALGLIYFFLAVGIYYIILGINKSSEMMQYIAFSVYIWVVMLGFVLLLS